MNNDYAICKILDVRFEYENDPKVLEVIDKILKKLNTEVIDTPKNIDRGCCDECGEGYDNEKEWLYNTECQLCGHPIPEHLIVKRP